MKLKKILFSIAISLFIFVGCKNETKKETLAANKQNVTLAISGMTCEIGCAKTIQSKLSKKEGVLEAKVIFTDSIANIAFDANTTSKEDLMAFVDGIAGGELYKTSAIKTQKSCQGKNAKECASKKECSKECMKKCLAEGKDCKNMKDCKKGNLKKNCDADKKCDSLKMGKKACCAAKKNS